MAADKALIAGAAKVAGAKANLDYSITKAATELGSDIEEVIQLNLKNLQETDKANTDFQNEQYASVASSVPNTDDLNDTPFSGVVQTTVDSYVSQGNAFAAIARAGGQTFDHRVLNDPILKGKRKDMGTAIAAANHENDYITESRKNYLKNSKGRHIDPTSGDSILATSIYNSEFEWKKNEETGKYVYIVNSKEYSIADARAAMDKVSSPDISKSIFTSAQNNTKNAFKGATNNAQAEQTIKDFKRNLDPIIEVSGDVNQDNLRNAEMFYIGQNPGVSVGALRKHKNFITNEKYDEKKYAEFLSREIDNFLNNQKNQHYTPPEVVEEDVPEGDTPHFIAQVAMLDKITSKFNKYRVGEKPGIDYYLSQEFQEMLPEAFSYFKHKGKVQIQAKGGAKTEHTIDPSMSLEYNMNMLKPMLLSKKK